MFLPTLLETYLHTVTAVDLMLSAPLNNHAVLLIPSQHTSTLSIRIMLCIDTRINERLKIAATIWTGRRKDAVVAVGKRWYKKSRVCSAEISRKTIQLDPILSQIPVYSA